MRHIAWGHANTALVERFCQATIPKQFHFISFSEEFSGSGKVWCLIKESNCQHLSGLKSKKGRIANKWANNSSAWVRSQEVGSNQTRSHLWINLLVGELLLRINQHQYSLCSIGSSVWLQKDTNLHCSCNSIVNKSFGPNRLNVSNNSSSLGASQ